MCPDSQVLSVYYDGELPDPWRKQLEAHLATCSQCRGKIARYRRIGLQDAGEMRDAENAARKRVWQRMVALRDARSFTASARKFRSAGGSALWRRSVSLPFPVAAAAALAIAVLTLALFGGTARGAGFRGKVPESVLAAETGLDVQGIVPAADMNGVLQYLGSEESADFVIIRLPENKNFASVGQPVIIKAAEYPRRNTPR